MIFSSFDEIPYLYGICDRVGHRFYNLFIMSGLTGHIALHDYDYTDEPVDYILEPATLHLVKMLLPKVLKLKIYTILLDAAAAEHAASRPSQPRFSV